MGLSFGPCGWHVTCFRLLLTKVTVRSPHDMVHLCLPNQSIPRITSIPSDWRTIRSARNSIPFIIILTRGQLKKHLILAPGECVIKGVFNKNVGILCLSTNFEAMKEWDAPESNKTFARVESTRNSPRTTSGAFYASWTSMWLTRPRPKDCVGLFCDAEACCPPRPAPDAAVLALSLEFSWVGALYWFCL